MSETLLSVRDLQVSFDIKADGAWFWQKPATLKAVNGVSFELKAGETLGVVGESGCGKSTLARAIIGLVKAKSGNIIWQGEDLTALAPAAMRLKRREIQMIFQDPLASLNPRMTVGDIIAEPLKTFHPKLSPSFHLSLSELTLWQKSFPRAKCEPQRDAVKVFFIIF